MTKPRTRTESIVSIGLAILLITGYFFSTTSIANGQANTNLCDPTWINPWQSVGTIGSPFTAPGILPSVLASTLRQDNKVVLGGNFTSPAQHVVLFDPNTFALTSLGQGLPEDVNALATMPDGSIIAGGVFPGHVSRWNGTTWASMGQGLNGEVKSLLVTPDGELIAGGRFTGKVAKWTGTTWQILPGIDPQDTSVYSLFVDHNNNLIAGGDRMLEYDGDSSIGKWNGTTWVYMGDRITADWISTINEIQVEGQYFLVVGGSLINAGVPGDRTSVQVTAFLDQEGHWRRLAVGALDAYGNGTRPSARTMIERAPGILLVNGDFRFVDFQTGTQDLTDLVPIMTDNSLSSWKYAGLRPYTDFLNANDNARYVAGNLISEVNTMLKLPDGKILLGGRPTLMHPYPAFSQVVLVKFPKTADYDCSQAINHTDIFGFLNDWFARTTHQVQSGNFFDAYGITVTQFKADITQDGYLDTNDIFVLINKWFAGE